MKQIGVYRWAADLDGFADMLKREREAHALSLKEVAAMLGYSQSYIDHIERKRWESVGLRLTMMVEICNLFDQDPFQFINLEKIGTEKNQ